MSRTALSLAEIQSRLQALPQWTVRENALERVYDGQTYLDALGVLNAIAQLSEAEDHHPDLQLNWKVLTVRYWTHTVQGITDLDFKLAHAVDDLFNKQSS